MVDVMSRKEAEQNGVRFHTSSGGERMEEIKMNGDEGDERDGCQAMCADVVFSRSSGSTMT